MVDIPTLCKKCSSMNIPAVAVTDMHNLFGAMEFSLECQKNGIKGIIACRIKIEGNRELLLYCKDRTGYENLSYLISTSYMNSKSHEIRWEQLIRKSEGLLAIAVPSLLCSKNTQDIKFCAEYLNPSIEWYVGLESNKKWYKETAYMSQLFKTPVVAVSETCFLEKEQQEAHDVLLCIKNKKYFSQEDRLKSDEDLCFKSYEEVLESFPKFAIDNTLKIANKCNFMLEEISPKLPKFKTNLSEADQLEKIATSGLEELFFLHNEIKDKELYRNRLKYELEIVSEMGFAGYFLIVADFIKFAKDNGIPVGPGRGSCVASVIAWSIGITEIDPIRFDLVFERFLNPKRISIPDMDIDFSPIGRQRVIEYVKQKYGKQSVSGIITFGSLSSRAVLKDVGRVMQVPFSKTDNLSKQIQILYGRPFTLQETYDRDKAFANEIDSDESIKKVFYIAKQLEGLHRHASAHAAGVIITDMPIYKIAPLYSDQKSELPLIQFSMKYAESAGLVKFDFLGLTALDIIQETIKLLDSREIKIQLLKIPLDDSKTFEMLRSGYTQGIFQFETPGMTKVIKDMGADCIEDLVAAVALYRPGPMENIDLFIRSKKGQEKIEMIYPGLKKILGNTYGIMIYQEQILRIAQDIAGYTLAEADLLRRAIGKKILKEMELQKSIFIKKTHELQGGDISKAEMLFKQIETFANYGFNKSHAVSYAIIGYWGAYLKTHYPLEFVCASMDQEQLNTDKLSDLILDAFNINLPIKKPDINTSSNRFKIVDQNIIYSLSAIKNIGEQKASLIVEEREKNGAFYSIENLINRIKLNKKEVESLAKSGALDSLNKNRLYAFNLALTIIETPGGQRPLVPYSQLIDDSKTWPKDEILQFQKDVLGIYLDQNPLKSYPIKHFHWKWLSELDHSEDLKDIPTLCMIESYIKKIDKKKNPYLICEVFDISNKYRCLITDPDSVEFIISSKKKLVSCNINIKNGRIILSKCIDIEDSIKELNEIHIKVEENSIDMNLLNKMNIENNSFDEENIKNNRDEEEEIEKIARPFILTMEKYKGSDNQVAIYLYYGEKCKFLGKINRFLDFCNQIPNIQKCKWYAKKKSYF